MLPATTVDCQVERGSSKAGCAVVAAGVVLAAAEAGSGQHKLQLSEKQGASLSEQPRRKLWVLAAAFSPALGTFTAGHLARSATGTCCWQQDIWSSAPNTPLASSLHGSAAALPLKRSAYLQQHELQPLKHPSCGQWGAHGMAAFLVGKMSRTAATAAEAYRGPGNHASRQVRWLLKPEAAATGVIRSQVTNSGEESQLSGCETALCD